MIRCPRPYEDSVYPPQGITEMTEIHYELREKDLLAFNDHQLKKAESIQKTLRRHQATIPGFLALIALFVWFYYQDSLTAGWIGLIAATWGFGAPFFLTWNARRKVQKLYSDEDKARILGQYTLRIEPKQLVEVSKSGESRIEWKDVLRIEAAKNYAFIFVSMDSAIIIPRKTVSEGDILEFFKETERHIDQAA